MDTERAGFLVRGRVQGVGFRWWVHRTATGLGLAGSVRNRPDGAVEVHVEGSPGAVAGLAALLAEGPRMARVDEVTRVQPPAEIPHPFRIVG